VDGRKYNLGGSQKLYNRKIQSELPLVLGRKENLDS
jgi:hypothetical protein